MNIELVLSAVKRHLLHLIGRTPEQLWNKKLDKLLLDVDPELENKSRVILDNFHRVRESDYNGVGQKPNAELDDSLINVQLNALKQMRTPELVGFQPMCEPVGLVTKLQYSEDDINQGKLTLRAVNHVVEAVSRKLQLKWTIEAQQDMDKVSGLDLRREIELASSAALAIECDSDVVATIREASTKLVSEEVNDWRALALLLQRMSVGIAQRSRRGMGNWAILPIDMIPMLQENPNYLHSPDESNSGLRLMGELLAEPDAEHGIKIYVDQFQIDNTILVGYKGVSEIDTGFVYSPYIMALPLGISTDSETFQPRLDFLNRSGKLLVGAENYYTSMEVAA